MLVIFLVLPTLLVMADSPQEPQRATAGDNSAYEITIYNSNLGLVKDVRPLALKAGRNWLDFTDVAATIDTTSVHVKLLDNPAGLQVLEQNYAYDLVNPEKLLQKYLGKTIRLRQRVGNEDLLVEGTLLSTYGGIVLQTKDQILINPPGNVELDKLPEGLIIKPTLQWLLNAEKAGQHQAELSYLASGLNWQADYVCVANKDDTALDITGWVTLNNSSGATYKNAKLVLIAGDVHRVQPPMSEGGPEAMEMLGAAKAAPQFEERAFFEYHQYTLQRPTDVLNNQQKQVELLSANNVPAKKLFVFDSGWSYYYTEGTTKPKVAVQMEITNSKESNMGMPLPKGKVRVYKADADSSLQFLGEDEIDHTPIDEKVRVTLGNAFDVVGEHTVKARRQISERVWETDVEIVIRNHKDSPILVNAVDHFWGDWEITESSLKGEKKDASTLEFQVPVGKDGEAKITYTVRFKW
jgi:hypothetical protein